MCSCKKCTVEDWKQGKRCENPMTEEYPKFVLLSPNHRIAAQLQHGLVEENELYAMTEEIDKEFRSCSYQTWCSLKYEVEARDQRKQVISDIIMKLWALPIPDVTNIRELNNLFSKLHVSWFNFEPIRLIASHMLRSYPEVIQQWEDYVKHFEKYCSDRNVREYASILFNEESGNIFTIEIDEQYNEMKLSDIALLRESLSTVLGFHALSVHLVTVKGCLLLSFCYCFDDYINKFNLTPRQLQSLANSELCKITSLKDKHNVFDYNDIQNYKVCYLFFIV